ncbi:hypothetical protein DL93DRAFT_2231783 [Clavulina sp. PMI_390]|nr:hypothetical protein DL93DRAFT_2231783 [Clavulina sp. PMI_390]
MSRRGSGRSQQQPSTRDWRYIPSVSRSSGLEKDGDALTKASVQLDYYKVINDKLEAYLREGRNSPDKQEKEENLLIMFRKLREGLISSKRADAFAAQVYETSAFLAIVASSARNPAGPILSHLLLDFPAEKVTESAPSTAQHFLCDAAFIYLLDLMVSEYPSQRAFRPAFSDLRRSNVVSQECQVYIERLSLLLRRNDFLSVSSTTRLESKSLAKVLKSPSRPPNPSPLFMEALQTLMERLRSKARDTAWLVIRSAYREADVNASQEWLSRSLLLSSRSYADGAADAGQVPVSQWFKDRASMGETEALLRDGKTLDGRWTLRRPAIG